MVLHNVKTRKFKSILAFTLACLITISNSTYAASQTAEPYDASQLPKKIQIGIRTSAFLVGSFSNSKWGGFCADFSNALKLEVASKNLKIDFPDFVPIQNIYRANDNYSRYDGLQSGTVDIECGPNSVASLALLDSEGRKFSETIDFASHLFYKTGVRLLLREEDAQTLSSSNWKNEPINLKIGVLATTTTSEQLTAQGIKLFYPNVEVVAATDLDPNAKNIALDKLESGDIGAFASDSLNIKTLFERGVEVSSDRTLQERKPFGARGYTIFPSSPGDYLPHLAPEEWAIMVPKREGYPTQALKKLINTVLSKPELNIDWRKQLERSEDINPPKDDSLWYLLIVILSLAFLFRAIIAKWFHLLFNRPTQRNYASMSDKLVQAAEPIQNLIDQQIREGIAVDAAVKEIATDIAIQVKKNNKKVEHKLEEWGKSLGDEMISNNVKDVIKLAFRLSDIPPP